MNKMWFAQSRYFSVIVAVLVGVAILASVALCKNRATMSDPNGSLLASQAIIEHGTIRLDEFQHHFGDFNYQIYEKNGHFYYYFPLGTPLAAAPFVAVAKFFGADMTRHEAKTQLLIAAIVLMLSFLTLQSIAGFYLGHIASPLAATAFLFGTSFISTGATALWSHNFAALFASLAVLMLLREKYQGRKGGWMLTAFFLFMAYLCRPTLLILAPVLLAAQFLCVDKKSALKTGLALLPFATGFVAFSWHEFHQLLPDYYLPKRLDGAAFWLALYGNLASPARGLFVYSPFLLLPVIACPWLWKKFPAYRAELTLAIWPVLHLVAISKFPHWWAGYSYGPRLMYDVLPGLFIPFVTSLRHVGIRSVGGGFTVLAVLFAIVVNSGQGMFNRYTALWNGEPNVDTHPELLFDWRYPQFLHTASRHERRIVEVQAREKVDVDEAMRRSKLKAYKEKMENLGQIKAVTGNNRTSLGERYDFVSKALVFINWNAPESEFRWSDGYYAEIELMPDQAAVSANTIRLEFNSIDSQVIRVLVNGVAAGDFRVAAGNALLDVPVGEALRANEVNVLQFEMLGARRAGGEDSRIVSIAFKSLLLVLDKS